MLRFEDGADCVLSANTVAWAVCQHQDGFMYARPVQKPWAYVFDGTINWQGVGLDGGFTGPVLGKVVSRVYSTQDAAAIAISEGLAALSLPTDAANKQGGERE